ncbi:hypothetical protein LCGC14_2954610 [marine sediment metagenome]|uniref:Uncharacterized protein n=1 Tax=marine sediment metagenome TaxID=412755 RepID=A0A0F8XEW6_9ZZZZ
MKVKELDIEYHAPSQDEIVKKVIEKDRVEYPTLQNFVNKAIRDKIKKTK